MTRQLPTHLERAVIAVDRRRWRLCALAAATVVCALGTSAPAVAAPNCDVPNPPPICEEEPRSPRGIDAVGQLDEVAGSSSGIRVRGWAVNPGQIAPATVAIYVDGVLSAQVAASGSRPDVAAVHPTYGDARGYDVTVAAKGHPKVCADALSTGPGSNTVRLGCRVATQEWPAAPAGMETMTVATFNIVGNDETAAGPGYNLGSFRQRLDALADATRGFDVVGLQEVTSEDQVTALAARAGYEYSATGPATPSTPGQALLSRWPLQGLRHDEGPKPGCVLGMGCGGPVWNLAATVELHGKPIRIVNAHLSVDYKWPDGSIEGRSAWRFAQAKFIKEQLVDPFPGRVVVIGDFNGNADLAAPMGPLTNAFTTAASRVLLEDGRSHCGGRPSIDLILARSPMTALAYDGVYCPGDLSDHARVSAMLALGSTPPPAPDPEPAAPNPRICEKKPWTPGC